MALPESPEIPWESPKGKPQFNFASYLVDSILQNTRMENGLNLRNEPLETALLDELEQNFKSGDEQWIIMVGYKAIDYANELFLWGDAKGAKEILSTILVKTLIEQARDASQQETPTQKDA